MEPPVRTIRRIAILVLAAGVGRASAQAPTIAPEHGPTGATSRPGSQSSSLGPMPGTGGGDFPPGPPGQPGDPRRPARRGGAAGADGHHDAGHRRPGGRAAGRRHHAAAPAHARPALRRAGAANDRGRRPCRRPDVRPGGRPLRPRQPRADGPPVRDQPRAGRRPSGQSAGQSAPVRRQPARPLRELFQGTARGPDAVRPERLTPARPFPQAAGADGGGDAGPPRRRGPVPGRRPADDRQRRLRLRQRPGRSRDGAICRDGAEGAR